MRLLYLDDSGKFCVTGHVSEDSPYVILSHTWVEEEEVTFENVQSGIRCHKAGWQKLDFIAARAKEQGVKYFWVDTCCIDKKNHAELVFAIRSMYRWYQRSKCCYVFLQDVTANKRNNNGDVIWEESFERCRWLTRGWTLQELLAPNQLKFYAGETYLGDRLTLCDTIHRLTGIDRSALQGQSLVSFTFLTRLGWAQNRRTKEPEDLAYCLMGLCDVSMGARYGEGYRDARTRLENKIRKKFGTIALEPTTGAAEMIANSRVALLDRLKFDVMDNRKQTINRAMQTTCAWIQTHPTFEAWLRYEPEQNGFFWIKGHPGTGKSVLMKHIDEYISRNKESGDISISFYFNARGADLEKSFLGLYRSLLIQLLEALPDMLTLPENISQDIESNVVALQDLLEHVYSSIGQNRLFCFIDALDECQEEDVSQLIDFLQTLGQSAVCSDRRIFTCFASRHYPILEVPTRCQLVLEEVDHHSKDLELYVRQKLQRGDHVFVEQIVSDIVLKANGIFLWVVLVIEILKKEIMNGRTHAIRQRLKALPRGLTELFRNIIFQGEEHNEYLVPCLQWIMYAQRPLALAEFYFAMMVSIGESGDRRQNDADEGIMLRFLTSSSKGLAEMTRGLLEQVQFIHESVRDFLIREKGFEQIVAGESHSVTRSHAFLARVCIDGMYDDGECSKRTNLKSGDTNKKLTQNWKMNFEPFNQDERAIVRDHFPFFGYAMTFVLNHIDLATATNGPSTDLYTRFCCQSELDKWALKMNFLQTAEQAMYQTPVDLIYLCSERDLVNLLQASRKAVYALDGRGRQRYATPLIAALASKSINVARFLLRETGATDTEAGEIVKEVIVDFFHDQEAHDRYRQHEVIWALLHKHHKLSTLLLRDHDLVPPDPLWGQALEFAAQAGYQDCVVSLWKAHADTSRFCAPYILLSVRSAVCNAITMQHVETARWLLEAAQPLKLRCGDDDILDFQDIVALARSTDVESGHLDSEEILGADFDVGGEDRYSIASSATADCDRRDVAEHLIEKL